MNRGQILKVACHSGGNLGLLTVLPNETKSLAAFFFDLLTDHIYREDWSFLRKRTTVTADATTLDKIPISALPTDFRAVASLRPRSVNFGGDTLRQEHECDALMAARARRSDAGTAGATCPTDFAVDEGSRAAGSDAADIYVYPLPLTRLTYDLSYYAIPAVLTADTDVPIFPDHSVLVRAVKAWVMEFQREDMTESAEILAKRAIAEFRTNHQNKGRVNSLQLKMDPNYFGRITED